MITVHDVVNKEYKSTMLWKNRWFALPFVNYSIKKADLIWCNSNYTHSKLNLYYPNRKQQDVVIGDSCSTKFRKIEVSIKQKNEIYKNMQLKKVLFCLSVLLNLEKIYLFYCILCLKYIKGPVINY